MNSALSYFSLIAGVPGGCDLFHSRFSFGSGWMLWEVWSSFTIFSSWFTWNASTCGMYRQPFCVNTAAVDGAASSGAPAEMYTTTSSRLFPGPVTTVSATGGVVYIFAQDASFDMSIGFILAC